MNVHHSAPFNFEQTCVASLFISVYVLFSQFIHDVVHLQKDIITLIHSEVFPSPGALTWRDTVIKATVNRCLEYE